MVGHRPSAGPVCILVTSRLKDSSRVPRSWQCQPVGTLARELVRFGGLVFVQAPTERPFLAGVVTAEARAVTVNGPTGPLVTQLSRPWQTGIPGIGKLKVWAASGGGYLDRLIRGRGIYDPARFRVRAHYGWRPASRLR